MTSTTKVMLALVLGVTVGTLGRQTDVVIGASRVLEPLGTLWVNALRMVVIPLVVSAVFVAAATLRRTGIAGRLGVHAVACLALVLIATATYGVFAAHLVFSAMPIDATASASLRAGLGESADVMRAAEGVSIRDWFVALVPSNVVRAAADGAMLPLVVATIVAGLAFARIHDGARDVLVFARAVYEACLVIVRWVLTLTPAAVFILSLGLALRLGGVAAGAIAWYVGAATVLCGVFVVLLYPLTAWVGRIDVRRFARACAPAQLVAISTRSSLVALPALLKAAEEVLRLPELVRSFFLPLAVSTFRLGSVIGNIAGALFIARVYAVELGVAQLISVGTASVLVSFSVPGIPGGSIIAMVPVLMSAGLPMEAVGLLLAVDAIPDLMRTTANTTGSLSAATMLARFSQDAAPIDLSGIPAAAIPDAKTGREPLARHP